jgi:hypothetical protein
MTHLVNIRETSGENLLNTETEKLSSLMASVQAQHIGALLKHQV